MIKINLISPELKEEIKLKRFYELLKRCSLILLFILILNSSLLVCSQLVLQEYFNRVTEQTTLITKNTLSYNTRIRDINNQIASVQEAQGSFIPWTNQLAVITNQIPDGIQITYIKIDKKNINIRGTADTRDNLLLLKANLENLPLLKNLIFPLQNILQKNSITFDIKAEINSKELTKN